MPRHNSCVYMAHVCFMYVVVTVLCGDLWEVCCVAGIVFRLGVLYGCIWDMMDVAFSVCIVRRSAIDTRVWECECFVIQMLYACVHPWQFLKLCLNVFQFVNTG